MPTASEWKSTACILCECNCGIEVQLGGDDGRRFVRIRGDKAHPASQGYACEKPSRLDYYQNGRDRLLQPQRRRQQRQRHGRKPQPNDALHRPGQQEHGCDDDEACGIEQGAVLGLGIGYGTDGTAADQTILPAGGQRKNPPPNPGRAARGA